MGHGLGVLSGGVDSSLTTVWPPPALEWPQLSGLEVLGEGEM